MLTQEAFQKMNEATLRKEVLIPLLRAMAYNDVFEYHGGTGEQGKDIVAWKPDDLGERENLALVAKATQMSGKAQVDKGTAGEVQTQIRQCFGSPYVDPITGEEQAVHRVWVVSNKKIGKEAVNAIKSAVANSDIMRNVRFIDGDTLWSMIEKHLPLSMWHFVEEVRKRAQEVDSHYEPHVTIAGNTTSIILAEKFPGAAEEKPVTVKARFTFPNLEEAEAFQSRYQHHIETGAPIDLPIEFIGEFGISQFFYSLLGISDIKPESLQILPLPITSKLPVRIDLQPDEGDNFSFDYVLLRVEQAGTKEVTFVNDENDIPFEVKLVMRVEEQEAHLSIHPRNKELNAVQYSDVLKVNACLSGKLNIFVISVESGITLFQMRKEEISFEPPNPGLIQLARDLAMIQREAKQIITVPQHEITMEEAHKVEQLYQIITTGLLEGTWTATGIPLLLNLERLPDFIQAFRPGNESSLAFEQEEVFSLFNVEIPLGHARTILKAVQLENFEELESRKEELVSSGSPIELRFKAGSDNTVIKMYSSWPSQKIGREPEYS